MQIQIQPQQGTINYAHYFCRATASMHIVQIITMIHTNMRTLRHTLHHLTRSRLYEGIMPSSLHHWPVTQIQPLHISTNLFILPQTKGCTRPIQLCCALHRNVFQMHCNAQHTSPNTVSQLSGTEMNCWCVDLCIVQIEHIADVCGVQCDAKKGERSQEEDGTDMDPTQKHNLIKPRRWEPCSQRWGWRWCSCWWGTNTDATHQEHHPPTNREYHNQSIMQGTIHKL